MKILNRKFNGSGHNYFGEYNGNKYVLIECDQCKSFVIAKHDKEGKIIPTDAIDLSIIPSNEDYIFRTYGYISKPLFQYITYYKKLLGSDVVDVIVKHYDDVHFIYNHKNIEIEIYSTAIYVDFVKYWEVYIYNEQTVLDDIYSFPNKYHKVGNVFNIIRTSTYINNDQLEWFN